MLVELMLWCFVLIMLMAVVLAALYRRTGVMSHHALTQWRPMKGASGGEFVELWRLAYAAGLGGAGVLRPFIKPGAPDLYATSPPEAYRSSLETPEFVRLPWVLAFVFCLIVVGFSSFVLVGPLHVVAEHLRAMLLAGSLLRDFVGNSGLATTPAAVQHQIEALNWMMTAFIGSYIWSIGYLLWRMGQRDVTGHVFNTVSVRMLVAGLMGVVLFQVFGGTDAVGGWPLLLPLAAGLVPQWVMSWVLRKIQAMLQSEEEQRTQLSLTLLEGIDELVRVRLSEAGVDDAQASPRSTPCASPCRRPSRSPASSTGSARRSCCCMPSPRGSASCPSTACAPRPT
ncbi:MAG: hypothetical protein U1E14_10350 [Geminicoccaceae bacterium]